MFKTTFRLSLLLKTVFSLAFVGVTFTSLAKEGMWLPPNLKLREAEMKKMGLQIPIEAIYNEDGTGLNNAVVLFGRGCTGEIISSEGLVLTNHHCGYGTVQGLSSRENDYFANGFWAMNNGEELPCPGLTVTFIRKMENVTNNILTQLADTLKGKEREEIIAKRITNLEKAYQKATGLDAMIKPYFNGNQYWVLLSETFKDIRLVGFPPNGIGKFGGDTDNWMWPRHTGDFSLFRVYAGKNNEPAAYSADNKPYKPKKFFTLNAGGYKEGDFTMVYGFPGTTQEYISSYQLDQVYSVIDPIRIEVRTKRLGVWSDHMKASRDVFLKYTSKHSSVSNGWKKWQGEVRGLTINNVVEKKKDYEQEFMGWANDNERVPYAEDILPQMFAGTVAANDLIKANEYIREAVYGIEIIQQGARLNEMLKVLQSGAQDAALQDSLMKLVNASAGFYKNYSAATDKDVFKALMPLFMERNEQYVPKEFGEQYRQQNSDIDKWANYVFANSIATSKEKMEQFAQSATPSDINKILADPAWLLYNAITNLRNEKIAPALSDYYERMEYLNRLYMKSQMIKEGEMLYPDANLTLRLTYGKIQGIDPEGPAGYSYQTTLDGAVAKHNPDVEEFDAPDKLLYLQQTKNYGKWSANGTVPVGFIATNHTTGGNSGSPVLNAKGELIGTNFDRIWEGTMSDYYFDPNLCRNISVDVRYTLFVIEKFGNAGWLLKEMRIVDK